MKTTFAITGVWFKENKKGPEHISHVMLHGMNENSILTGKKTDKDSVVALLKSNVIKTLKWDYKNGHWVWGAQVTFETRNGIHYLRTVPDSDVTNNLDNLINLEIFPL